MCSMTIWHAMRDLHPFMPFLTEELWAIKGESGPRREGPLALGPWPKEGFELDEAVEAEIGWVVDLIAEIRSVKSEHGRPALDTDAAGARLPERAGGQKRARLEREHRAPRPRRAGRDGGSRAGRRAAACGARRRSLHLPLAGSSSILAAEEGLGSRPGNREWKGLEIAKVEAKSLDNADFIARAPEEVIAEHQERSQRHFGSCLVKLTIARERLERV